MLAPSKEDIAAADRLSAVFRGHSDEEIEAVLPILFLGAARGLPDLVLPAAVEERIGRLVVELGLTGSSTPEQMVAALDRHLQQARTPLLSALAQFFREENARGDEGAAGRAFSTFLGQESQAIPKTGEAPAGSVPAGPLARFMLDDTKEKK